MRRQEKSGSLRFICVQGIVAACDRKALYRQSPFVRMGYALSKKDIDKQRWVRYTYRHLSTCSHDAVVFDNYALGWRENMKNTAMLSLFFP